MNPKTLQKTCMGPSDIGSYFECGITHMGLDDAEKELQKKQGTARKCKKENGEIRIKMISL